MRGIKFRAWDYLTHPPSMIYFDLYDVPLHPAPCDVEIMQYTGLKDKNEKEIYEGDIVKTIYCDKPHHKGEVYFQSARLNWSVKHSAYASQDLYVYARSHWSVEVIGNKYENPELISGACEVE